MQFALLIYELPEAFAARKIGDRPGSVVEGQTQKGKAQEGPSIIGSSHECVTFNSEQNMRRYLRTHRRY
jgi:hypothetical protein